MAENMLSEGRHRRELLHGACVTLFELTDSEESFFKSSGPGVPTRSMISFNWSMSTGCSVKEDQMLDKGGTTCNLTSQQPLYAQKTKYSQI